MVDFNHKYQHSYKKRSYYNWLNPIAEDPCNYAPLKNSSKEVFFSGRDTNNNLYWKDAKLFCEMCNGKLIEPETSDDNDELLDLVLTSGGPAIPNAVWIGVRASAGKL